MTTDDPRITLIRQHGEDLYIPDNGAWREILLDRRLDDSQIPMADWVTRWLDECGGFSMAFLALRRIRGDWHLSPLLKLGDHFLRVHFEDVMCEHCNRRCGPSATPQGVDYSCTGLSSAGLSSAEVWAEFSPFPIQHCPYCNGILRRRQTIWLAAAIGATQQSAAPDR